MIVCASLTSVKKQQSRGTVYTKDLLHRELRSELIKNLGLFWNKSRTWERVSTFLCYQLASASRNICIPDNNDDINLKQYISRTKMSNFPLTLV